MRNFNGLIGTARARAVARYLLLGMVAAMAASASAPGPTARVDARSARGASYPDGRWQPGPARYGAQIVDDVPVKMDDGVVLRAMIAYPTDLATGKRAAGRFPVIIEHTPYVTLARPVVPNVFLTEHGYIYAVVRARATGASGGGLLSFQGPRDGEDGKDIVLWAAHELEGSDGRVGEVGCSYPGALTLGDLAHLGPNSPLKAAIAACVGLGTLNRDGPFMLEGLPTTGFLNFPAHGPRLLGSTPPAVKFFHEMSADILAGGEAAYDDAFWERDHGAPMGLARAIVRSRVPVLLWSGWSDPLVRGALHTYTALQNGYDKRPIYAPMTPRQRTTPKYQIIVGNWRHAGGLDAGVYLEWFDTWLKGVNTGLQQTDTPMHLYELQSDRWINAARYPLVSTYSRWYLEASGALESGRAGAGGKETLRWGSPAQPDGQLSFSTAFFSYGVTLAGPISATVYASSSNTNLELLVTLYDVGPDGTANAITRGALLGSQRELDSAKSWTDRAGTAIWPWPALERDSYLTAGKVYRFDIVVTPTQWAIEAGHRLRLQLTAQSPADICPPSGIPRENGTNPCGLTAPQRRTLPGGSYQILYGPRWPSALNLPQLPWKAFASVPGGSTPSAWSESTREIETHPTATLPLDWGSGR